MSKACLNCRLSELIAMTKIHVYNCTVWMVLIKQFFSVNGSIWNDIYCKKDSVNSCLLLFIAKKTEHTDLIFHFCSIDRLLVSELPYKMEFVFNLQLSVYLQEGKPADRNITIFEETRIKSAPCSYEMGFIDNSKQIYAL